MASTKVHPIKALKAARPCPFCKQQPIIVQEWDKAYSSFSHRITCSNPNCVMNSQTPMYVDELVQKWNTRLDEDLNLDENDYNGRYAFELLKNQIIFSDLLVIYSKYLKNKGLLFNFADWVKDNFQKEDLKELEHAVKCEFKDPDILRGRITNE